MIALNRKHSKIELVDNLIVSSNTTKRRHTKIMNFGSVFRPLYFLSRIFGFASFSISTKSKGEIQNPKIYFYDGLWFLTVILMYLVFAYDTLNTFRTSKQFLNQKTWVMVVCARLTEVLSFIHGILAIIMNVVNRFKLMNMVKMYNRFDKEVWVNDCVYLIM